MVEINLSEKKNSLLRTIGRRLPDSTDMLESKDELILLIDVPGCRKEDIELTYVNGLLKVNSERDDSYEGFTVEQKGRPEKVSETVPIPVEVSAEDASAKYKNGVLKVRLPKEEDVSIEEQVEKTEDGFDEETQKIETGLEEVEDEGRKEVEETQSETEEKAEKTEHEIEEGSEKVEEDIEEGSEKVEEDIEEDESPDMPESVEEVEEKGYRDLQDIAKELGIRANQKKEELREEIIEELDL